MANSPYFQKGPPPAAPQIRGHEPPQTRLRFSGKAIPCPAGHPRRKTEMRAQQGILELERDREGIFKAGYPDKDNHHIDAVRYACEDDMKRPSIGIMK